MKSKRLLNALGNVDDIYIEEAAAPLNRAKNKRTWLKWGALAACLCVVLLGVLVFYKPSGVETCYISNVTVSEDGVYIPPTEVSLSVQDGAAHNMMAFFIYQGRCYVQYEWIYDEVDFIGEYLGTATGMINEWTPADGYVELAGSIEGDFYSVDGFDPGFMLCMEGKDGSVEIYINDNDLTLKTGADLFEERLHLSDNYTGVSFETRSSWYHSENKLYTIDEENVEIVENFIAAMDEALFMRTEDIPLGEGQSNIYDDLEIYHVYFKTESGIPIHLRLFEGGYVRFQGIMRACVKVDGESFDNFVDLLNDISQ